MCIYMYDFISSFVSTDNKIDTQIVSWIGR